MNTLQLSRSGPSSSNKPRRSTSFLFVSVGLHVLAGIVLLRFLISPNIMMMIFGAGKSAPVPVERIGFLRLPKVTAKPVIGRSGGNNRPVTKTPPVKIVAPTEVPTGIPPVAPAPQNTEPEAGSGSIVGTGGPARGIRPSYTDPRLWPAPGDVVEAPKTSTQRLDSVIADIIKPYNDSLAVAAGKRQPGDWTIDRDGKKYGIDPKWIHLGKFSIPTALLGMLPINTQANPILAERNRTSMQLHSDIMSQAQRGMNEADFKKAVKSIRERKERERAAAASATDKKNEPANQTPAQKNPPDKG